MTRGEEEKPRRLSDGGQGRCSKASDITSPESARKKSGCTYNVYVIARKTRRNNAKHGRVRVAKPNTPPTANRCHTRVFTLPRPIPSSKIASARKRFYDLDTRYHTQVMMRYMKTCARPLELTPAKTSRDGWKTTTLWMEVITSPPVTSTADGFFPAPLSPRTL